ncbi:hypothetical protein [Roseibium algae]|uniref:Uncharacterized protein n=1 Tax=Roseibium algae TaxID=3123038 RepID=A0ABU8TS04_9HYPH
MSNRERTIRAFVTCDPQGSIIARYAVKDHDSEDAAWQAAEDHRSDLNGHPEGPGMVGMEYTDGHMAFERPEPECSSLTAVNQFAVRVM